MKLSNLILEEYQEKLREIEEKSVKLETFRVGDQTLEAKQRVLDLKQNISLKIEAISLRLPTLIQAHKDALYMEEQIEKEKPRVESQLERNKREFEELHRPPAYKVVNNPCSKCGEELSRNNEMVLLSDPPQYQYNCIQCGITECKVY